MTIRRHRLLAASAALLAASGCAPDDWGPDHLAHGKSTSADRLEFGRTSYEMYCIGCHGAEGDGNGPAAKFLDPKPRDLRLGRVKFAGVPSGQYPRDIDYDHTIKHGLMGTAMPAFPFIPQDERSALIAYIRTFNPEHEKIQPGAVQSIPKDPYKKKGPARAIRDGERMYHGLAACHSCHAAYTDQASIKKHMAHYELKFSGFRPNLYDSVAKESEWGAPITPPDFLTDRIKTGAKKEDIVRVIATGVGGTAMPNWGATLKKKQLWSLAYYVEHIASLRGTPEGAKMRASLLAQEGAKK